MKSIQHVLWRGALALALVVAALGTGLGMPPAEQPAARIGCDLPHTPVADAAPAELVLEAAPANGPAS